MGAGVIAAVVLTLAPVVPSPSPLYLAPWDDAEVPASAFRGRTVVVDAWASWCAPCMAQLPALERLSRRWAGRGVLVAPLSQDRQGPWAVARAYSRAGVRDLPILTDPQGAVARALGIEAIPTTLVYDRQGREVARFRGARPDLGPALEAVLRRLDVTSPLHKAPR